MRPGIHRNFAQQRIRHGEAMLDAVREEIALTRDRRMMLVTSPRQAASPVVRDLRAQLGPLLVGGFEEVTPHAPLACVVAGAAVAREVRPDCLIAIGGGSTIDAAKAIVACVDAGVRDEVGLRDLLRHAPVVDPSAWDTLSAARILAVPTTLSAAECNWFGGVTDPADGTKRAVAGASLMPRTVIYDPVMTADVPLPVFLASGVKAIDHAAERLGAMEGSAYSDALAEKALSLLGPGLLRVRASPDDMAARLACQIGAWLSMAGAQSGARVGASHALGHVIGSATGAVHGYTSCVCLAPVLRWNAPVNAERQVAIARGLGSTEAAADAVNELVSTLGLPRRLRDIGVPKGAIGDIAARALQDPPMLSNPRRPADLAELQALVALMW